MRHGDPVSLDLAEATRDPLTETLVLAGGLALPAERHAMQAKAVSAWFGTHKVLERVALDVPAGWTLVAYLCLGFPAEEHLDPELERHHWEVRSDISDVVFTR